MFCRECGSEIEEGAKFCMNCGTPVMQLPEEELQVLTPELLAENMDLDFEQGILANMMGERTAEAVGNEKRFESVAQMEERIAEREHDNLIRGIGIGATLVISLIYGNMTCPDSILRRLLQMFLMIIAVVIYVFAEMSAKAKWEKIVPDANRDKKVFLQLLGIWLIGNLLSAYCQPAASLFVPDSLALLLERELIVRKVIDRKGN